MKVVIGIGSNLGDRLFHIQKALVLLDALLLNIQISTVLESSALLLPSAPADWDLPFLNCAVAGDTSLSPGALLQKLQEIELMLAPPKTAPWAPRSIDLDILAYGDQVIREKELLVPHPGLLERSFTLHPMAQLLPYWKYPVPETPSFGKTLLEILHTSPLQVKRFLLAKPYLVGIVNLALDSFSDGGNFVEPAKAITHALELGEAGASFIELGAASTRPGAELLPFEEEWRRLHPVLSALSTTHPAPRLSLDTYNIATALRALEEFDISLLNFLGDPDRELVQLVAQQKKQLIIMHNLTIPPTRTNTLPYDEDPLYHLLSWAKKKIADLEQRGLHKTQLIFDPGISFGKTAIQNLTILKRIKELKKLEVAILVGHSRKAFMRFFSSHPPSACDPESVVLSLHLAQEGVDYLRVHNVKMHSELLATNHALSMGKHFGI